MKNMLSCRLILRICSDEHKMSVMVPRFSEETMSLNTVAPFLQDHPDGSQRDKGHFFLLPQYDSIFFSFFFFKVKRYVCIHSYAPRGYKLIGKNIYLSIRSPIS